MIFRNLYIRIYFEGQVDCLVNKNCYFYRHVGLKVGLSIFAVLILTTENANFGKFFPEFWQQNKSKYWLVWNDVNFNKHYICVQMYLNINKLFFVKIMVWGVIKLKTIWTSLKLKFNLLLIILISTVECSKRNPYFSKFKNFFWNLSI